MQIQTNHRSSSSHVTNNSAGNFGKFPENNLSRVLFQYVKHLHFIIVLKQDPTAGVLGKIFQSFQKIQTAASKFVDNLHSFYPFLPAPVVCEVVIIDIINSLYNTKKYKERRFDVRKWTKNPRRALHCDVVPQRFAFSV